MMYLCLVCLLTFSSLSLNAAVKSKAKKPAAKSTKVTVVDSTRTKDPIVAEYKGGVVVKSEISKRIEKIPAQSQARFKTTDGQRQILDLIVQEDLFYQKALALGVDKDSVVTRMIEERAKPMYLRTFYQEQVTDKVVVTDQEKQDYYTNHLSIYYQRPNSTIQYLMAKDEAEAKAAMNELKNGSSFKQVSDKYSQCSYSKNLSGVIKDVLNNGYIPGVGNSTSLDSLIVATPVDTTAIVYFTDKLGHHIFRVIKRVDGRQKNYEEVSADIERRLRPEKENAAATKLTDNLKAKYNVKLNQAVLDSLDMKNMAANTKYDKEILIDSSNPALRMTVKDFLNIFNNSISPQEQMLYSRENGKQTFADQQIARLVYSQESQSMGYDKKLLNSEEYVQLKRFAILQTVYKRIVADLVKVTPEEAQDYYEKNKSSFSTAANRKIQALIFDNEKEANKIYDKYVKLAKSNKIDKMNELVTKYSLRPENNGMLDNIYQNGIIPGIGEDKAMNDLVWSTPLNAISKVITNTKKEFVFFRVVEDRPLTYKTFADVEQRINGAVRRENETVLRNSVTEDLKKEFALKVYPERLIVTYTAKELFDMSDTAARDRNYKDAILYYDQIISQFKNGSDDYKALFMKAFLLSEEMKETDKAIAAFEELLAKFPDSPQHELNDSARFMLNSLRGNGEPVIPQD